MKSLAAVFALSATVLLRVWRCACTCTNNSAYIYHGATSRHARDP